MTTTVCCRQCSSSSHRCARCTCTAASHQLEASSQHEFTRSTCLQAGVQACL
jgi:hypothetical protein